MARITGKNGKIIIGSDVIAIITDWSIDAKIPLADATAMGDQFAQKLSLIREWTGQLKGNYGDNNEAADVYGSFFAATTDGGATSGVVTLALYPDGATAENWNGTAYLDFSLTVDKAKTNEFSAKFTGTGALVRTPN